MPAFEPQNVFDRRAERNFYLSILVDLGVTYKRTLGLESARAFLGTQDIPVAVVNRILSADSQRRLTDWEEKARTVSIDREIKP